ncbi:PAS domain-containing protein [Vibrio fluvialis]|uniref:sensor domain-containing diguanylate cyclase n=1 Tax=Vibrio fluvialis TaxID=676 RepID=UPI00238098F2|nr:PAS domain-containing protein [Vibrio fluvialis]WDY53736.1 PAS domain-containing protein [Vibrio fluvialis]
MKGTITLLFASTGELLSHSAHTFQHFTHLNQLLLTSTDGEGELSFADIQHHFPSSDALHITTVVGGTLYSGQISSIQDKTGQLQYLVQIEDASHPSILHIQRMKQILDCAQIATWEWNVQTGETKFNERWAGIVGHNLDELAPTDINTWLNLAHPDDLALSEVALNAHFNGEQPYYECEARMRHKDGHWVWVRDYGRIVSWDQSGNPEWMLGTHIDISAYKHIQAQNELLSKDLNMIMDLCPTVIYKISADKDQRVQFITRGVEALLMYKDADVINQVNWWRRHIHPQDLSEYDERVAKWRAQGENAILDCEYRFRRADGQYIWLADRARTVTSEDGRSQYYVGSIIDISELVSLNNHLQSLAKVSPAVLYQFEYLDDGSCRFPYASQKLKDIFGVSPEDAALDATPVFDAIYPEDVSKVRQSIEQAAQTLEEWKCEFRVNAGGKLRWLYGHSIPSLSNEGKMIWSGQLIDISEKKELELRLQKESTTDPLTGAYNRRYFLQELHEELLRSSRDKQELSILAIDFDFFKQINDRFGHDAGDYVLQQISQSLQSHLREYDTLARMGGEEFTVLLPHTDYQTAFAIADKLRRLVEVHKMHYQQQDIMLTVTIGVASTQKGTCNPFALLKHADRALYQGKENGRNCVC